MRTFNNIFVMPKDSELFIAAWSAICAFEDKLRSHRYPFQTVIVCKENWLTKLIVSPMTFIVEDTNVDMSFDLAIDLSDDRIIELGKTGRTAASVCGVLIGLDYKIP